MALYDDVYGLTYNEASSQMLLLTEDIKQRAGNGFESIEDIKQWAHDHLLDKVVFHNMGHSFLCVSHKGEIMNSSSFEQYYGDILFVERKVGNRIETLTWSPKGFEFYDKAYIPSEYSDGNHKPLYYRNYCVPTGFYDSVKDAFNVAKPFPVFAKETNRDTSHIYTYIEHLAGECAFHVLAWLRAKLLYPTIKTQVVLVIVSRAQGSGKTTFAEVICKGLFGKENVIVSDQYDATARFNSDYADALVVCQEEKEETDKRNPAGTLKSRATATTIRKEQKGIDPIYQDSYTDFIMTTNKDVPIKFDGREDQRRFMVMEADPSFTRKTSELADEVFTKLYGYDANFNKVGTPFVEDKELIAQFKHELFSRADIAAIELRNFPKTAAYNKCFSLPRTSESADIESIMRSIVPFIKESLIQKKIITEVDNQKLTDVIQYEGAMQYMPEFKDRGAFIALCRPLVFYEMGTMKPYKHSTVERGIYDCGPWLLVEYGIMIMPDMEPLLGGFTNVVGRYRTAPSAKFCLVEDYRKNNIPSIQTNKTIPPKTIVPRVGERFRVNRFFKPDTNGCFETVNEMKVGTKSLENKTNNIQYLDTFLLESDSSTFIQSKIEFERIKKLKQQFGMNAEIKAEDLYKERLNHSLSESQRLFDGGIVARIVYSGAKSYHLLIRVSIPPENLDEYKWLHGHLATTLTDKLQFDDSTCDPARLTRSPLTMDRVTTVDGILVYGEQKLVCENWTHLYELDWRPIYRQWLNRPLTIYEKQNNKPLYPTRREYITAMEALLDGSFWISDKFNGDRQRLFFPAYRLLRALGYTHNHIWDNIIYKYVDSYIKKNEIEYWKTRKDSTIIAKIDNDIDENMEDKNE